MKPQVVLELPALVSEVVRLMHEQEVTAANASYIVVTQKDCWPRYKELLKATNDFLASQPGYNEVISPARTEHSLPPPSKIVTFLSASAEALAKIEEDKPVLEFPPHRDRMFG